MQELIGHNLDQYEIIEKIGQGGMATVFKARQPRLDRWVAIKVLPPHYGADADFRRRFLREARAIARLEHPHILPVYDFGQQNEYIYLVMRYIEQSRTLDDAMYNVLTFDQILNYLDQVAAALDYAHQHNIVHRDIKPSNILLKDDWAFLADFGLAYIVESSTLKMTRSLTSGTPAYMSPEQASGRRVDTRSDVYALGVIAFEMLTGEIPHAADTDRALTYRRNNEPAPSLRALRPDLDLAVDQTLQTALAPEPDERYQTGGEFVAALRQGLLEAKPARSSRETTQQVPVRSADSPAPSPEATDRCSHCGSPVGPDAAVCDHCGERLVTPAPSPPPTKRSPRLWPLIGGLALVSMVVLAACSALWFNLFSGDAVTGSGAGTPSVEPTSTATPLAPGTGTLFSDEFDRVGLDSERWTSILGMGQVQVFDGVLRLSSGGQTFPLIYPARNPLPPAGNFSLMVSLRHTSAEARGTGFRLDAWPAGESGPQPPGENIIGIWQDADGWRIVAGKAGTVVHTLPAPDVKRHEIEISYIDDGYHVSLDGESVYASESAQPRPDIFWFGSPVQAPSAGPWSGLEIHTVSVESLGEAITTAPTVTPEPTPRPTASPLPTLTPTATPRPQSCGTPPADRFADTWQAHRTQLGCPTGELKTIPTHAEEAFEGGYLFWRNDNDQVYIILDRVKGSGETLSTGEWAIANPEWRWDGSNPDGVGLSPPANRVEPKRGFGWLWRNHLGAENGPLGWALDREYGFDNVGQSQPFERGLIFKGSASKIYVLLDKGTFYAE